MGLSPSEIGKLFFRRPQQRPAAAPLRTRKRPPLPEIADHVFPPCFSRTLACNPISRPWFYEREQSRMAPLCGLPRTYIKLCGWVALGGRPPRAPTDPYVDALDHTVPQVMGWLLDVGVDDPS